MKRNGIRTMVASGAVGLALAGTPVMALTEFVGGGFLSDFSGACAPSWPENSVVQITTRVRPAGDPGNEQDFSTVNIFTGTLAMHFRWRGQNPGVWGPVANFSAIGNSFTSNPDTMPRIRVMGTPSGTTLGSDGDNAAHVVLEMQHFGGISNCNARANVWLHRR